MQAGVTEKGEHRDDTQDQGTVQHATGRGKMGSWDKILSRRNGQAPFPRHQSTAEQCQLDSAAVHTGVPKDEMRNMLVSG